MLEIKKGTELQGRYVIGDSLGSGGFAVVWKATDKALQDVNKALRLDPENHHAIRLKRRLEAEGGG